MPSINITPGIYVQEAADNIYINEETIDRKATELVLYQTGQFCIMSQIILFADHSQRLKALMPDDISRTMLDFSAYGKPSVSNFVKNMHREWYSCNRMQRRLARQKDMAWTLVRLCSTKLFKIDLIPSPTEEQQVPSWGGFNAIVHKPIPVTTVGYCPMINGSSTKFSTMTVMKNAQTMMDRTERHSNYILLGYSHESHGDSVVET